MFITFELPEGGGAALIRGRRLFEGGNLLFQCGVTVLISLLRPAMVQAVGTVAGPGALEKESQQLSTMLSEKYCIYSMKRLLLRR